jgi:NADH-quinone oxidoreductase subunit C
VADTVAPAAPGSAVSPLEALVHAVSLLPGVSKAALDAGEVVAHVAPGSLLAVLTALRDDPQFGFEQLMDLCGVDWPERPQRFDAVYNLLSVSNNHRIRVIAQTDGVSALPSVHELWPCATWWEREAFDLFGILFSGQPDLRRIVTDYGFEGHPLRKDFPLTGFVEVKYDEEQKRVVNVPVSLTQDFRNFDFISPWEGMVTLPGDEKAHVERQAKALGKPVQEKPA